MALDKFQSGETYISGKLNAMIDAIIKNIGDISDTNDAIASIRKKLYPLTATVSISPSALREKGSGQVTVAISWGNIKIDGKDVTPTKVTIDGSEITLPSSVANRSTSDTKSWKVIITAEGTTYEANVGVTYVYPIYIFFSTESDYGKVALSNKQPLATSLSINNKAFSNSGNGYLWVCSPYDINSVKSVGGLDIAIAGSVRGTANNLKYWRSNDKLNSGTWNLTIK